MAEDKPIDEFQTADTIPKIRQVDAIGISILRTVKVLKAFAGSSENTDLWGMDMGMLKDIAIGVHIDARHRGIDLEALDTGAPIVSPSGAAQGPPEGQWDIQSQEDQTPQQVRLYNLCTDKIENYLVQIGTPQADATKAIHQFLEGMYVEKFNQPMPKTQKELKRGPMSYLITQMKEHYPKAIPPREGQA